MDPNDIAPITEHSNDRFQTLPSTASVAGTLGPHEVLRLTDASGNTALHKAVHACATRAIETLLATMDSEGIQLRNNAGESAFCEAFRLRKDSKCVELLASYATREDLDELARGAPSALIRFCLNENYPSLTIDSLLELLTIEEWTQHTNPCYSVLSSVASIGQGPSATARLMRILERAQGAGVDAARSFLRSALLDFGFGAASSSSVIIDEAIRSLSMEDLVSAGKDGRTPIHNLAAGGLDQLRAYLDRVRTEGGMSLSDIVLATDLFGTNALHIAAVRGEVENLKTLLECVDAQSVKQRDGKGHTAFDLAFGEAFPIDNPWLPMTPLNPSKVDACQKACDLLLSYQGYEDYQRLAKGNCHELLARLIEKDKLKSVQEDMIAKFPKEEFLRPLKDGTNLIMLCSKLDRTEALGQILDRFREMPA
ncbi:MAG: hypothetical protein KDK78_01990, partial [Chlamydiia bacterium]|nr:hypothetical protein [Chlamydiia bacterium]